MKLIVLRKPKIRRHDSHNFVALPGKLNLRADNFRIATKVPSPHPIAKDYNPSRRHVLAFVGQEAATLLRLYTKQRKQIGGNSHGANALGLAGTGKSRRGTESHRSHARDSPRA